MYDFWFSDNICMGDDLNPDIMDYSMKLVCFKIDGWWFMISWFMVWEMNEIDDSLYDIVVRIA